MKNLFLATTVLSAISLHAGVANAADFTQKAQQVINTYFAPNWAGTYVGADIGYGWTKNSTTNNALTTSGLAVGVPAGTFNPASTFGGADASSNLNGVAGGFHIGHNFQVGNWVLGPEVAWNFADMSSCNQFSGSALGPQYNTCSKVDMFGDFHAKLGYSFGTWMPYILGGGAVAHTKGSVDVTPGSLGAPTGPTYSGSQSDWVYGWVAGVGLALQLNQDWIVRAEYKHYDFGDQQFAGVLSGGAGTTLANYHLKSDLVQFGVSRKF